MAYCTLADIQARRGPRIPSGTTATGGKVSDEQNVRVNAAITDAAQIIHQIVPYLADANYTPSDDLKATLRTISVDIAIYRMVDTANGSEDERKRYEDALSLLRDIVKQNQRGLDGTKIQTAEAVSVSNNESTTFKKRELL